VAFIEFKGGNPPREKGNNKKTSENSRSENPQQDKQVGEEIRVKKSRCWTNFNAGGGGQGRELQKYRGQVRSRRGSENNPNLDTETESRSRVFIRGRNKPREGSTKKDVRGIMSTRGEGAGERRGTNREERDQN